MNKNEKEKSRLDQEFEMIQNEGTHVNVEQYLVTAEQLPDFGKIEIYDYDKDLAETSSDSLEILQSLVDLYVPEIKDNPYILSKMKEDARIYGSSQFLERMSQKLLIQQLKQIDSGDSSARMFETSIMSMKEMRETLKDGRTAKSEIEKMYKQMRSDLGLNEIQQPDGVEQKQDHKGRIIDTADLNNKLEELLKSKDEKRK